MARDFKDIVPYTSVYIDASLRDFTTAMSSSVFTTSDRNSLIREIKKIWTNPKNTNSVLPCLSVRTALDLYLTVKNFPPGSEIIMSAINIPDMVRVVKHHGLHIISLDVDMETCAPKHELLKYLITERTVAILVAHIYGKIFNLDPIIDLARHHGLPVIEDCAEAFCGFDHLGDPRSDISLFSFGPIKFITSFGGAVAKVLHEDIYHQMAALYDTYPHQPHSDYMKRVCKCLFAYTLLDCPKVTKSLTYACVMLGIDHKKHVVSMLRGFPSDLVTRIRVQPCTALLDVMLHRMTRYHGGDMVMVNVKGDYVTQKLHNKVTVVGNKADVRNYWLYPIIVENPDAVYKALNALGVDAYRGATQLSIVEADPPAGSVTAPPVTAPPVTAPPGGSVSEPPVAPHLHRYLTQSPHEARFIIDHVIYLPVNKNVPFRELDRIISAVDVALRATNGHEHLHLNHHPPKLTSKL